MIKKVKIKHGVICELILLIVLVSCLIYKNYMEGSINAFLSNSETDYIKWVDFDISSSAMGKAYEYDVESQTQEVKLNWIELLAYLGTRYGGDFSRYKEKDLNELVRKLQNKEENIGTLT